MSETATATEPAEPQAPPVERWEDESIDRLDLPEKLYAKLHMWNFTTLGRVWENVICGEVALLDFRDAAILAAAINRIRVQWQPWRTRDIAEFADIPPDDVDAIESIGAENWGDLDDKMKDPSVSEKFSYEGKSVIYSRMQEADAECRKRPTPPAEPTPEPLLQLTPTVQRWDTPEALAAYDAETVRLVNEKNAEVEAYEAEWDDYHAQAALAKKQFENAGDELRALIRTRADDRGKAPQKTLFDDVSDNVATDSGMSAKSTQTTQSDVRSDLWRQYPITIERWERFGLTAKDVEKLNSGETKNHGTHPILVLGDVSSFITPNPANPSYARTLKDVKGFGDAAYDRWCEAETQFWAWYGRGGDSEFAIEMGVAGETAKGTPEPDRSESQPDAGSEPATAPEPEPAEQPEPDQADADGATTDAERKPNGKPKRKRKKATA